MEKRMYISYIDKQKPDFFLTEQGTIRMVFFFRKDNEKVDILFEWISIITRMIITSIF